MSIKEENAGYQRPDISGDNESDPAASKIERTPNGDFKLALFVPKLLYGGLIGPQGSTKRRIEEETQSEIWIPHRNEKSNEVIIKAKQRDQICAALHKIRIVSAYWRKKIKATHILTVALNFGEIQKRFVKLRKRILKAQLPGIDEGLFISEHCLHFTLGVYVLLDDKEHQRASSELQACRALLTDLKTPFEMKVKGLVIMNDDPSCTRDLYGRIESKDLQKFADRCAALFRTTGFALSDSIQMHMKIMNIRFRKEAMKAGDSFDAREILKRFGDFDFGTAQCKAVHLCLLRSRGDDKFYKKYRSLQF